MQYHCKRVHVVHQHVLNVRTPGRGTTEITEEIARVVRNFNGASGIVHIFPQHTSCAVVISENADPSVRVDLETLAQRWVPDGDPAYRAVQ
jgi:secondary thiamine-phosphate synthase enzyme